MQSSIGRPVVLFALALGLTALASGAGTGCAKGEADSGPQGAGADTGGAGQGGSGTGGTTPDASIGGSSGSGGVAGSSGTGGLGGSAGSGDGGDAGVAGSAGAAGSSGTGGTGGSTGGTGGNTGGTGGSTGGTGGTGGALNGTLFFSEYVEGDLNNKALELFNGSATAIDLTNCLINRYQNGSSTAATNPVQLAAGTLASGQLYTVCSEYAESVLLAYCDQTDQRVDFNGNDAVELVCNGVTVDVIGQIGMDPTAVGWGTGDVTTTNHTLIRKCSVTQGRTNGSTAFDPAVEWDGYPLDTFDHLGTRSCP